MYSIKQFRLFSFVFAGLVSIMACAKQPANTDTSKQESTPSANHVLPPPAAYASDKEGWLVNIEEAYAQSEKENKPILANFTGSDWCGWCKRLDQDVFSTPKFKEWAKKNVVLLEVDFPKRKTIPEKNKEQNAAMASSLKINAYPTVWILDVEREPMNNRFKVNPIGKTGYVKSPEEFIGALSSIMRR